MFRLKRKYEFHAARKLTALRDNHPCGELHGHTLLLLLRFREINLLMKGGLWIL